MAKRILIAQCVILGLGLLGLFINELPGAIREVRMWRMASFRTSRVQDRPRGGGRR